MSPNSEEIKKLPEQYFNVPVGITSDPNSLYVTLDCEELNGSSS